MTNHGASDESVSSLRRRISGMHHLLNLVASGISLQQVNYRERAGVLPIAFSLMHVVTGEDRTISRLLLHETALWDREDWSQRVGVNIPSVERGTPVEIAEQLRFTDLDAWRAYQTYVFARTERELAKLTPRQLSDPVDAQLPPREKLAGTYLSFVVLPDAPIRLSDVLECFV
jgi:hypothetical protein